MLLSDIKDIRAGRFITGDSLNCSWIGVDLDGTLAEYTEFKGCESIGKPILKMVEYVKDLINKGENVKIFTARIDGHPEVVTCIQQWLQDVGLPILPVTNIKDPGMKLLIDDRARQVIQNTGKFVSTDAFGKLPDGSGFFTATVGDSSTVFQGIKIHIENPKGSVRKGINEETGEHWSTKMFLPYGEIKNTEGVDGDPIDIFVGPDKDAKEIYIIHQKVDGKFDEDKVFCGFSSKEYARLAFCAHYDKPEDFLGPITTMTIDDFKEKLKNHKPGTKLTSDGGVGSGIKGHRTVETKEDWIRKFKHQIEYSCGHKGKVKIFWSKHLRLGRLAAMEKQLCPSCFKQTKES